MSTRTPRQGPHPPTAARHAAARLRALAAALAALTSAVLTAAAVPAASAHTLVRDPPGGAPLAPVPAPAPTAVTSGMAGWQITLIALGAALIAAITAVSADRALAARRAAPAPTA